MLYLVGPCHQSRLAACLAARAAQGLSESLSLLFPLASALAPASGMHL